MGNRFFIYDNDRFVIDFDGDQVKDWYSISQIEKLSEQFISKYADYVNWELISENQQLSEPFIERYQDRVYWNYISMFQTLSENFIEKYSDKVFWDLISKSQQLSESFIERFQNYVDWDKISERQTLSEDFIEKFQNKVNWDLISEYQYMSQEFIENHQDKINWDKAVYSQRLSKDFLDKHKDKINVELVEEDVPAINSKASQLLEMLKSMDEKELIDVTQEIIGNKFSKMSKEETKKYDQVSLFIALEAIKLNSFSAFNIAFNSFEYRKGLIYGLIITGFVDDSVNPLILTEIGEQKLKDLYNDIKDELHCDECPRRDSCIILQDYGDI